MEKLKKVINIIKKSAKKLFLEMRNRADERQKADMAAHGDALFIEKNRIKPFPLAIFFTTIKVFALFVVLVGCAGVGLVLGVAKAYIDTTPELDLTLLSKTEKTSYIYDVNGNLVTTFGDIAYRDWAEIEEIPDMLINAIIAIEDVRFYRHAGVDYKRLFGAVVGSLSASSDAGGSTITQQLVKNKLLTSEVSYRRKIQEAYLSLELEQVIEKDDIIESYLNDVYLGESNYGMKTAAKDYFGKDLKDLTIRECAMLAGMIKAPNTYNPRKNTYSRIYTSEDKYGNNKMDVTDARTNIVINSMYDAGVINKEQYEAALTDEVKIIEKSNRKKTDNMLYFVEYATRDIVTRLLAERNLLDTKSNRVSIENEIAYGGYSIYLTMDKDIQNTVQSTLTNWDNYPELVNPAASKRVTMTDGIEIVEPEPQAASVVIDHTTGQLRAIIGGRETPSVQKGWNRAYMSETEVGSSIKPLTVYGPALDLGLSPASMIANLPMPIEGWDTEEGYPNIGAERHIGLISMRRGIVSSLNVAAARLLMEYVTPEVGAEYLRKLGVDESRIQPTGSGLSLGSTGITPIEMAAAYATIANAGVYIEPISFTRVVDAEGKVILDARTAQKSHRVYKESTAYVLIDLLENAVRSGTGTNAKIPNINSAGKTGTNMDYSSAYFSGITPYYTSVIWVGHDDYSEKLVENSTGGRVCAPIWKSYMEKIHEGLENKPIIDKSPVDLGLVKRTVCPVSGLLATQACTHDAAGLSVNTDWFTKDAAPTDYCDMHASTTVCTTSMQPASFYCPDDTVKHSSIILVRSGTYLSKLDPIILKKYLPHIVFAEMSVEQYERSQAKETCLVHYNSGSTSTTGALAGLNEYEIIAICEELIDEVTEYLNKVQNLPEVDRATLETSKTSLVACLEQEDYTRIESYYDWLKYNYTIISQMNPPAVTPEYNWWDETQSTDPSTEGSQGG